MRTHVLPHATTPAAHEARFPLAGGQALAGAGIGRPLRAVRGVAGGPDLARDVRAGAKARVKEAARVEPVEGLAVLRHVARLAAHRLLPIEAQPSEVLLYGRDEVGAAAAGVYVFDPQQEAAAGGAARERAAEQRRVGVAEVQETPVR